jgi:hypothetical protein
MTTKCGIRGIKNIKKIQNVENKIYCFKGCDETVDKGDNEKCET